MPRPRADAYDEWEIDDAGGLYIDGDNYVRSSIIIDGSSFLRNTAQYGNGAIAGVVLGSGRAAGDIYFTLLIKNCVFDGNNAQAGAAIMNIGCTAFIDIRDTTFANHISTSAYATHMSISSPTSTLMMYGVTFRNNQVSIGISISCQQSVIDSCTFSDNAPSVGGSSFGNTLQYYNGIHLLTRCVFARNSAVGGALFMGAYSQTAAVTITDSLFIANTGTANAGAIQLSAPNVIIRNTSFINNIGVQGSAIYQTYANGVNISDCTFRGNIASTAGTIWSAATDQPPYGVGEPYVAKFSNLLFDSNVAPYAAAMASESGLAIWNNCTFMNHTSSIATSSTGGGAIALTAGIHRFISCSFINNSAVRGGAIMVSVNGGLVLNQTLFINNRATLNGGAVYATTTSIIPIISTCNFQGNYAAEGGAASFDLSSAIISLTNFISNQAIIGGGITVGGNAVTVTSCVFSSNSVDGHGGAIYHTNGALMITLSTFTGNSAINTGGAYSLQVKAGGAPTLDLVNSTMGGNTAATGGALSLTGGIIRITNSVFTINTAVPTSTSNLDGSGTGGAITVNAGSMVTINNTVFDGNRATTSGGAISHGTSVATVTITNSIMSNNHAVSGGAVSFAGPFTSSSTIYESNMASKGASLYASVCPLPLLSHVMFVNNTASRAGGAYHWSSKIPLCNTICVPISSVTGILSPYTLMKGDTFECTFSGNQALVGNDISTEAHHLVAVTTSTIEPIVTQSPRNDTSGIPPSISALDGSLTVQVRVLDYFGQLMSSIDGVTESILITLTTAAGVIVNGRSTESVIGGIATFSGVTFSPSLVNPSSSTMLSITAQPSLSSNIMTSLQLTDVVLPSDDVTAKYSGGTVVLALLVAVVGSWTGMIFIEEAVFHLQGKRKSHVPYSFVASVAFGLCGIWGAYVMEMSSLTIPSVAIDIRLTPGLALGIAPVAIILVWFAVELYVREFGGRAPRIQQQKRVDLTYGTGIGDRDRDGDDADNNNNDGSVGDDGKKSSNDDSHAPKNANGAPLVVESVAESNEGKPPLPIVASKKSTSSGGTAAAVTKKPKIAAPKRDYPFVVRLAMDFMVPRLLIANIILAALQVGLVTILVVAIRWQISLVYSGGTIIAAIIVGVITSHVAFWLMLNLSVARFICPFAIAASSLIVFHVLMAGNTYTYQPYNTWSDTVWAGDSYAIIISAITAVMCFLFIGIQFSRMQLSRNALHTILKKAKGQITILDTQLAEKTKQSALFEKNASDLSRIIELISYCGPTYTAHSLALTLAKDKKGHDGHGSTKEVTIITSSATVAALTAATATNNDSVVIPSYTPNQHSDTGIIAALARIDDANMRGQGGGTGMNGLPAVVSKHDNPPDLSLRDLFKNAVTLEIFKHFMISEHAAESLGLYLDIQRYKMLGSKESRATIGHRMVREYLEDKSAQEVNVSQITRLQVMKEIAKKNWSSSLFEPVEKALYSLMAMDTLVRFKKTKQYTICSLLLNTYGSEAPTGGLSSAPPAPPLPLPDREPQSVTPHSQSGRRVGGSAAERYALPQSTSNGGTRSGASTPVHMHTSNNGTPPPSVRPIATLGLSSSSTPKGGAAAAGRPISTPTVTDAQAPLIRSSSLVPVASDGIVPLSPQGTSSHTMPLISTNVATTSSTNDILPGTLVTDV